MPRAIAVSTIAQHAPDHGECRMRLPRAPPATALCVNHFMLHPYDSENGTVRFLPAKVAVFCSVSASGPLDLPRSLPTSRSLGMGFEDTGKEENNLASLPRFFPPLTTTPATSPAFRASDRGRDQEAIDGPALIQTSKVMRLTMTSRA